MRLGNWILRQKVNCNEFNNGIGQFNKIILISGINQNFYFINTERGAYKALNPTKFPKNCEEWV